MITNRFHVAALSGLFLSAVSSSQAVTPTVTQTITFEDVPSGSFGVGESFQTGLFTVKNLGVVDSGCIPDEDAAIKVESLNGNLHLENEGQGCQVASIKLTNPGTFTVASFDLATFGVAPAQATFWRAYPKGKAMIYGEDTGGLGSFVTSVGGQEDIEEILFHLGGGPGSLPRSEALDNIVVVLPDTDGDGVPDVVDICPLEDASVSSPSASASA